MFEMDAYVGVDVLGLSFMKGEQPHAGGWVGERQAGRQAQRTYVVERAGRPFAQA